MNKRKILLIFLFVLLVFIVVVVKCIFDSDNIVEFRLGIKDLDLRFVNYGVVNSKELEFEFK